MTDLWIVARVEVNELPAEQRDEALAWIRELGVEPKTLRPWLVVTQDSAAASYRLHLSRFVLDEHGDKVVDHAAGPESQLQGQPLVLPITSFPAWLPQAWQTQQNGAE